MKTDYFFGEVGVFATGHSGEGVGKRRDLSEPLSRTNTSLFVEVHLFREIEHSGRGYTHRTLTPQGPLWVLVPSV